MRLLKALVPAWLLVLVLLAFSLWARSRLPDAPIAVHFDARWRPDSWWPRDAALFRPVAITAALLAVMTAAPFVLPPKGALQRSATAYGAVCAAVAALMAAIQVAIVAGALHWPFDGRQVAPVAIGAVFLVMGNFMTKLRYNLLYGVRTPWTLANEAVWDRTHRMAGPVFMAGGLFVIVAGLARPQAFVPVLLLGALVPAAASVIYSYVLWSRLPPDDRRRMRAGA